MSGLSEGRLGRFARFAEKFSVGHHLSNAAGLTSNNRGGDLLDVFTKADTGDGSSTSPAKAAPMKGTPNKKNQRKVKPANTPLSSDPANPISTNPLGGI